jgi:hypothetical protein
MGQGGEVLASWLMEPGGNGEESNRSTGKVHGVSNMRNGMFLCAYRGVQPTAFQNYGF